MDKSDRDVIKTIVHYKESLLKYSSEKNLNEPKLVYYIGKLYNVPVKIAYLEETGIGLTVNSLRKLGGEISEVAKALIAKWKKMVVDESDNKQENKVKDTRDSNGRKHESSKETHREQNEKYHRSKSKSSLSGTNSKSDSSKSKHSSKESHSEDNKKHGHRKQNGESSSKHKTSKRRRESSSDTSEEEDSKPKYRKHSSKSKYSSQSELEDTDSDVKNSCNGEVESSSSEAEEAVVDKYKSKHEKSNYYHKEKSSSSKEKQKSSEYERKSSYKTESKQKRKKEESESEEEEEEEAPTISSSKYKREKEKVNHHHASEEKHKRPKTVETNKSSETKSDKHDARSSSSKHSSKDKHKNDTTVPVKAQDEKKVKKETSKNGEKVTKKKHSGEFGIDSGSGASFAEALGMLEPGSSKSSPKKKLAVSSPVRKDKSPVSKPKEEIWQPKLLKEAKLEPLDINLSSLLPTITPNYRPLSTVSDNLHQRFKVVSDDEALSRVMSSKNQRTKVYSGNKPGSNPVPSLFELCTRVLQDNIDALEYTGGVPYSILKPVLERATPDQLFTLEHHNPYLIEDTDELWHLHCMKGFKNKRREELESWREMYMRCSDEREAKLQALTANIKQSQDKSLPVRQTKLAYVDSFVKPPREVARKQAKNGIKVAVTPSARLATLATAGAAGQVAVPNPGPRAMERSGGSSASLKPKKAPLMQKALALIKNRFKR